MNDLISTKELAKKLDVTEVTIWRWRKDGLPSIRLNHSVRFKENEVMEWLLERGKMKGGK